MTSPQGVRQTVGVLTPTCRGEDPDPEATPGEGPLGRRPPPPPPTPAPRCDRQGAKGFAHGVCPPPSRCYGRRRHPWRAVGNPHTEG